MAEENHQKNKLLKIMEILRQETDEEHWGYANRIVNGRAVCDSHHIADSS